MLFADVAELADALDLGSSVTDVGVQVPSSAPYRVFLQNFKVFVCHSVFLLFFSVMFSHFLFVILTISLFILQTLQKSNLGIHYTISSTEVAF